jgi:hypothetical protein
VFVPERKKNIPVYMSKKENNGCMYRGHKMKGRTKNLGVETTKTYCYLNLTYVADYILRTNDNMDIWICKEK